MIWTLIIIKELEIGPLLIANSCFILFCISSRSYFFLQTGKTTTISKCLFLFFTLQKTGILFLMKKVEKIRFKITQIVFLLKNIKILCWLYFQNTINFCFRSAHWTVIFTRDIYKWCHLTMEGAQKAILEKFAKKNDFNNIFWNWLNFCYQ